MVTEVFVPKDMYNSHIMLYTFEKAFKARFIPRMNIEVGSGVGGLDFFQFGKGCIAHRSLIANAFL